MIGYKVKHESTAKFHHQLGLLNTSLSTFPDDTLAKFTTLLPQCLVLHGTWEVALVESSWPGLIENVTEGLFSYQLNRDEQNRDTSIQETIVERPRFGNGMVSMYVPRNLLKRNNSTLEGEFSPQVFFHNERLLQFVQLYPPIHVQQPLQQCWMGYQSLATYLGRLRSIPVTAPQIQRDFK